MHDARRTEVISACRRLAAAGLVRATAGNVSVRVDDDLIAITPTGARFDALQAADVAIVDRDGRIVSGALEPSSELAIHLGIYERLEAGAVVHAHPVTATALSCVVDELPCVHEALVALGGAIRVARYAPFGTADLAAAAIAALEGRRAALLANHGTVAIGDSLAAAVVATEVVEWASAVFWRASAIGQPRTLSREEQAGIAQAMERRRYGQTQPVGGGEA